MEAGHKPKKWQERNLSGKQTTCRQVNVAAPRRRGKLPNGFYLRETTGAEVQQR